ncbi:MAG: DUF4861 family protein [Salinivirgaceae bacterium]|jgi:hypothetical protein|nr:DUF4861 family protein [Salinivirgaceae bacterium]
MKKFILIFSAIITVNAHCQNMTDISLKWKDSVNQESVIESETGNLYKKVEHHGPAVENEWMGLRLYFDHKVSIDVYNKTRPGLELEAAAWYPTVEQQKEGWGADLYKVGSTVGLGGVRLWDYEKNEQVLLDPVKNRRARVRKEANTSYMEMLSEGVAYMGDTIDVLVRVTVFSGIREAKVEAFAFSSKPVRFYTGINYHDSTQTKQTDNFICSWGIHPEDVAAFRFNIGAAILFNPNDFEKIQKSEKQYELISKPTKYIETWITSACEKEVGLNSYDAFVKYIETIKK